MAVAQLAIRLAISAVYNLYNVSYRQMGHQFLTDDVSPPFEGDCRALPRGWDPGIKAAYVKDSG